MVVVVVIVEALGLRDYQMKQEQRKDETHENDNNENTGYQRNEGHLSATNNVLCRGRARVIVLDKLRIALSVIVLQFINDHLQHIPQVVILRPLE